VVGERPDAEIDGGELDEGLLIVARWEDEFFPLEDRTRFFERREADPLDPLSEPGRANFFGGEPGLELDPDPGVEQLPPEFEQDLASRTVGQVVGGGLGQKDQRGSDRFAGLEPQLVAVDDFERQVAIDRVDVAMRNPQEQGRKLSVMFDHPTDDPPRDHERRRFDTPDDPPQFVDRQSHPKIPH
jgi:hypothetical protein